MDKWYQFYWWVVDDNQLGIIGKALNRIVRRLVKKHLDKSSKDFFIANPINTGINATEPRSRKLVCSMTSFPARIEEVWISIETVFRQTVKADEIILWLSKDQFRDRNLPDSIKECEKKGLTVRWVDGDLRSHKKYFYVLQEYKNADVVLLDDDLYYPDRLLENLVNMAKRHPNAICATRVHKMIYNRDGSLKPYRNWIHNYNPKKEQSSKDFFLTSGIGTLIPTGIMPPETFDEDVFRKICFYADDVWINLQAKRAGIEIYKNDTFDKDPISIGKTQTEKLVAVNVLNGGNDKQIEEVMAYYSM